MNTNLIKVCQTTDRLHPVNHSFIVFLARTYALEFIVVVEVNVSEVILIQQLKSSVGLQIDNSTTISTVNITTGKCRIHCPFTNNTHNRGRNQSTD